MLDLWGSFVKGQDMRRCMGRYGLSKHLLRWASIEMTETKSRRRLVGQILLIQKTTAAELTSDCNFQQERSGYKLGTYCRKINACSHSTIETIAYVGEKAGLLFRRKPKYVFRTK
jgi:hypothetical protein